MEGKITSKKITFIAMMAALGNVLSFLSIRLAPIIPSVPLGPTTVSLALDLSHLATFMASILGGPLLGGLTGFIGGLIAAFEFGFSKGNIITGIGLPIGKSMTGIAAGLLASKLNPHSNRLSTLLLTVLAYIPEGIITAFIFIQLYPLFFGLPIFLAKTIATQILVKAFVEMIIMGILLKGILENQGLMSYIRSLLD